MLQDIRERFIGTTGKIVLAFILLLLAGTGLNYTIAPKQFVAKVNGEDVSGFDFNQAYQSQLARFGGQDLPPAFLDQIQTVALEQTVGLTALRQHLAESGYRVSDKQVSDIIRQDPAFQVDGVFDADLYGRVLAQQFTSPSAYEDNMRKRLTISQFQAGLTGSAFMTPAEFRNLIELSNQEREIEYAVLSADAFVDQINVTDDDIALVYESSPTRFQTPERVDVEYVLVDDALARDRVDMSDAALETYFDSIKDQYVAEEQRRARHVLLRNDEDPAAATALATTLLARITAGESFEDIATEYSDDGGSASRGGDLGFVGLGDFVGPVEEAVFSMQPGELSGIVQSEFGLHIIRLEEIRAGDAPTLASERADVEARYQAEQQGAVLLALQQELGNQLFSADSLDQIAAAMNLEVQTTSDYTANSTLPFGASESVRSALFGAEVVEDGKLRDVQIDDVSTAVIRVTARQPSGRQPLADVADAIRAELTGERAQALADEQGAQLAGVLSAQPDIDFETLIANTPAELFAKRMIGRRDADVPPAIAAATFDAVLSDVSVPAVGNVSAPGVGFAVYRVTRVVAGSASDMPPQQLELARNQLAQRDAQLQLDAYGNAVRETADIEYGSALEQNSTPDF